MIYYYKLWQLLNERNVSQNEIIKRTGVTKNSFSNMRANKPVSLEVIDKICTELNVDVGDIVTNVPDKNETTGFTYIVDTKATDKAREILKKFMNEFNYKASMVAEKTGLSLNTVKSYLDGNRISTTSQLKLFNLGEEYVSMIKKEFGEEIKPKKIPKVYCSKLDNQSRKCPALHKKLCNSNDTTSFYCVLGFSLETNEKGDVFTCEQCHNPKTLKDISIIEKRNGGKTK